MADQRLRQIGLLGIGFVLASCQSAPEDDTSTPPPVPTGGAEVQLAERPDPSVKGVTEVDAAGTSESGAAHELLITHAEAVGAGDDVTRTRDEARALAEALRQSVVDGEATFEEVLAEHSESLYADRNCYIPPFPRGSRPAAFEDPLFELEIGEMSEVLETPKGFHVLERAIADVYIADLLVIAHGPNSPGGRSRFEALQLVGDLHRRATAHPDSFRYLAREYTDGPRASMGGNVGMFHYYTYGTTIGDRTRELEVGGVSEPFETKDGYVFLRRTQ